jgi:hypothetical protein
MEIDDAIDILGPIRCYRRRADDRLMLDARPALQRDIMAAAKLRRAKVLFQKRAEEVRKKRRQQCTGIT